MHRRWISDSSGEPMWNNLSDEQKIIFGLIAALVVIVGGGAIAYKLGSKLMTTEQQTPNESPVQPSTNLAAEPSAQEMPVDETPSAADALSENATETDDAVSAPEDATEESTTVQTDAIDKHVGGKLIVVACRRDEHIVISKTWDIDFETGKSKPTIAGHNAIRKLQWELLKVNEKFSIELRGYAEQKENIKANLDLATDRTIKIRERLLDGFHVESLDDRITAIVESEKFDDPPNPHIDHAKTQRIRVIVCAPN